MLRLLLIVLPLGLDTLGVSISLGIRSVECGFIHHVQPHDKSGGTCSINRPATINRVATMVECGFIQHVNALPPWLGSALLFSFAETVMPLVGLTIGSAVSLFLSSVMHILGPLLLIGVGLWELLREVGARVEESGWVGLNGRPPCPRKEREPNCLGGSWSNTTARSRGESGGERLGGPLLDAIRGIVWPAVPAQRWGRQLLLALSVSLDELAIGFSLGAITSGLPGSKTINTITLCILIGLQGFLMTLIGLTLGRTLRVRVKSVKEWTEFLSCFLLMALGVWLLLT